MPKKKLTQPATRAPVLPPDLILQTLLMGSPALSQQPLPPVRQESEFPFPARQMDPMTSDVSAPVGFGLTPPTVQQSIEEVLQRILIGPPQEELTAGQKFKRGALTLFGLPGAAQRYDERVRPETAEYERLREVAPEIAQYTGRLESNRLAEERIQQRDVAEQRLRESLEDRRKYRGDIQRRFEEGRPIEVDTVDAQGNPVTITGQLFRDGTFVPAPPPSEPSAEVAKHPKPVKTTLTDVIVPGEGGTPKKARLPYNPYTASFGEPPRTAGGITPGAVPPTTVTTEVAKKKSSVIALGKIMGAWEKINAYANREGQGALGRIWRTEVGGGTLGKGLSTYQPEYRTFNMAVRNSLNAYVKAITGAQFSVKELQRYEAQYPHPNDTRENAEYAIKVMVDQALADMEALVELHPEMVGYIPQDDEDRFSDLLSEKTRKDTAREDIINQLEALRGGKE